MMILNDLLRNFKNELTFLNKIRVTDSENKSVNLPPILEFNTGLVINAIISKDYNRLIILLPRKSNLGKWLATLISIEMMKLEYQENLLDEEDLKIGEKYLLDNKFVVEFDGFEIIQNKKFIKLKTYKKNKTRGDNLITIKKEHMHINRLQPISDDRKLSTTIQINRTLHEKHAHTIDKILDIRTMGNHSIFKNSIIIADKIGETIDFINENRINSKRLKKLFLWGKIDVNGKSSNFGPSHLDANPICKVARDLYSAVQHIKREENNIKGIILNNPINEWKHNPDKIDYLTENNIPAVLVCDLLETKDDHINFWLKRNFKVWKWEKDFIEEINNNHSININPFKKLNNYLNNYTKQKIIKKEVKNTLLRKIVYKNMELLDLLNKNNNRIMELYYRLMKVINKVTRTTIIPEKEMIQKFNSNICDIMNGFKKNQIWIKEEVFNTIEEIKNSLIKFINNFKNNKNPKFDKLKEIIDQLDKSQKSAIILNNIDEYRYYWKNIIDTDKKDSINFFTLNQFISRDIPKYDNLIICGWHNYEKIYKILHSFLCKKIYLLFYTFENEWFNSAMKVWNQKNNFEFDKSFFSNLINIEEARLSQLEKDKTILIKNNVLTKISNRLDFELNLRNHIYKSYVNNEGDTLNSKLIEFSDSYFGFFTEGHSFTILTELITGEKNIRDASIKKKNFNELINGDYVMFWESDKNIIEEIAERKLREEGRGNVIEISKMWKTTLKDVYESANSNFNKLIRRLKDVGCNHHPQTIKKWLFDKNIIGPRDYEDIDRIAKISHKNNLNKNITNVKETISTIKGAHISASNYLKKLLLEILPEKIKNINQNLLENLEFELENYGNISLLKVENISDETIEVDSKNVNKLLTT